MSNRGPVGVAAAAEGGDWQGYHLTPTARVAIGVISLWFLTVVIGPELAPHGEGEIISEESFAAPGEVGLLGTDYLGRDVLSRLIHGARMTLGVALVTTTLAFAAGISLGFFAALAGGWIDNTLGRTVDAIMAFPSIMLALIVIGSVGTSLPVVIATVAIIGATRVFRVSRALALDVSVMDYVDVARARGETIWWIMRREVLPNTVAPLVAEFGLRFTFVILFISALSFLGLGVQPPSADWGVMVRENLQGLLYGAAGSLLPAACIASVTVAINLLVDWFLHQRNSEISDEMLR